MKLAPVIGVLSGCGGAGGSTFAAVLADRLSARGGAAGPLLLDCDCLGGGIDLLLGCEQVVGPRWSQVRLRGGDLAPAALRADLPRWRRVSFLAADSAEPIDAQALAQIVEVAAAEASVVIDLPRWRSPTQRAAISLCDVVVLVTPAEVRSVTATALAARAVEPANTVLAVRGSSRSLSAVRIGETLGVHLIGELPYDLAGCRSSGFDPRRVRRRTVRVADAVIDLFAERLAAA